ncbi:MAG: hypothetical protein Q7J79_09290, partial [Gemmatimonadales bacterium]|nr:hypothetical protein [Gemmatimonadales bacterium]
MSGALLFLVIGVVAGSLLGWLAARRALPGPGPAPVRRPFDDDLPSGDTSSVIAGLPVEASFESLAYALVERCALRVGLPCALIVRELDGAPAVIAAVAGGLDARLVGFPVELDSPAGRAITDGIPVVGQAGEPVV